MFGSNFKRSGKRISLESDRIDLFSYIYIYIYMPTLNNKTSVQFSKITKKFGFLNPKTKK